MSNLTVACLSVGEHYRKLTEIGRESHTNFCLYRNFIYLDEQNRDSTRPISWSKIILIQKCLPTLQTEFLLYLDADTLITNSEFDFTPYIYKLDHENTDLLLVRDSSALNAGVMLIRNTTRVLDLFQRVWERTNRIRHKWWEQAALIDEYRKNQESRRLISVIPKDEHGLLNPTSEEYWTKDSLLIHFAGLPKHSLIGLFRKYKQILDDSSTIRIQAMNG